MSRSVLMTLLVLALSGSALYGCGPARQPVDAPAAQPQPAADAAPDVSAQAEAIPSMSGEDRRAALGAEFPVEVPVPQGTFVRANAQGADVWDYELMVAATPEAVAEWYRVRFTGRSWVLVDSGARSEGGYYLVLRKNAAEARFDVSEGDSEGTARVKAVVGVGAAVLEVQ